MDNEKENKSIKVKNIVESYKALKDALISRGMSDEVNDLTLYTLANSVEEGEACYPSIITTEKNEQQITFIILKRCPLDDAKIVVTGKRRDKMIKLFEVIKNKTGKTISEPGIIEALEEFES